jgi:serine/threonine protein kinase
MGEVYKATDTRLSRTVAIKVLPSHFTDNAEMRLRFDREAHTVAALNHPHICTLHDVGRQGDTDFLVMEYLEGETLAARIERGPCRSTRRSTLLRRSRTRSRRHTAKGLRIATSNQAT